MRCNLVVGVFHSLDYCWPWCRLVVDLSFAYVVAGNEECCFGVVSIEQVENMVRI